MSKQRLSKLSLSVESQQAVSARSEGERTCSAATSKASWPMWLDEREADRSSMEMLMLVKEQTAKVYFITTTSHIANKPPNSPASDAMSF